MKKLHTLILASILVPSGIITTQKTILSNARVNQILCIDDSKPGWKIPNDAKIIISWNCEDISQIHGLSKALDSLMSENSQYKNIFVLVLERELKKNHTITPDSSPYTDTYIIKIDFNEKDDMSSLTKEYTYNRNTGNLKEKVTP